MGSYDDIGLPVKGQPISSGAYGIKVRNAIIDLDRRVSSVDTSTGTGKAFSSSGISLSGTSPTAEVAALTIAGMVFKAGLAYEASMRFGMFANASTTLAEARIRKFNATPASGADWGEYFRFNSIGTSSGGAQSCLGTIFLINNTAADITSDVNLCAQLTGAAGTITATLVANATSPRYFIIKPAGFAADYVGMGAQVS
jgi:hypothetical protein